MQYGGVVALDDVSLEVRRGEIVGLIGANGAGKSTFFNAVSGLAPVTGRSGTSGVELVASCRRAAARRSASRARSRTWASCAPRRVRENVLLAQTWLARTTGSRGDPRARHHVARSSELRRRAEHRPRAVRARPRRRRALGDLPYGTMRIVEIASAVAAGPDLLLLDEASAGLGPEESHALGDRFLALRDELGSRSSSSSTMYRSSPRVCDYAYCLESGALIAEGTPARGYRPARR